MDIDRAMLFVIMWGIPAFAVVRGYLKMDKEERNSAKSDFQRPDFIFTVGFLLIGLFIAQIGSIFSLKIIKIVGLLIIAIGGIAATIDLWGRSKLRSLLMPVLITVTIFLLYN